MQMQIQGSSVVVLRLQRHFGVQVRIDVCFLPVVFHDQIPDPQQKCRYLQALDPHDARNEHCREQAIDDDMRKTMLLMPLVTKIGDTLRRAERRF